MQSLSLSLSKKHRRHSEWQNSLLNGMIHCQGEILAAQKCTTSFSFWLSMNLYLQIFFDTPSLLWLINVVVFLINEMGATISLHLRILGAQGLNFLAHHVKSWSFLQACSWIEALTRIFRYHTTIEEITMWLLFLVMVHSHGLVFNLNLKNAFHFWSSWCFQLKM